MLEVCAKCDHFHQRKAQEINNVQDGQCRRYPPQVFMEKKQRASIMHYEWPVVLKTDWCGEWIGEQSLDEQH